MVNLGPIGLGNGANVFLYEQGGYKSLPLKSDHIGTFCYCMKMVSIKMDHRKSDHINFVTV